MNTEQATDQAIDISNEISEAIAEIMDVADDLRRTEVDELVEVEWNGCTNGEKVADRLDRLRHTDLEDLQGTIEAIADEISAFDDDEMAKHFELETRELDSNLELYQERLEAAANRLGQIVVTDAERESQNDKRILMMIRAEQARMETRRDYQQTSVDHNPLVSVDDWMQHKIAHAKREVWDEAIGMLEQMFSDVVSQNDCGVDTAAELGWLPRCTQNDADHLAGNVTCERCKEEA